VLQALDDGVASIALTIPSRLRPDTPILQRSSYFPTDVSLSVHAAVRTVVRVAALAVGLTWVVRRCYTAGFRRATETEVASARKWVS
jgi:hypothetical protein